MINVSLDDCTCACKNAEIIKQATTGEVMFYTGLLFLFVVGICYLFYWLHKEKTKKKDKYIEVKIRK